MPDTPISLLNRLQRAPDPADWFRFAELYSPLLLYWGKQLALQEADAADLAQDVLARVWQEIGAYHRRPGTRFRAWLWTVTRNRHRERARRRRPGPTPGRMGSRTRPTRWGTWRRSPVRRTWSTWPST